MRLVLFLAACAGGGGDKDGGDSAADSGDDVADSGEGGDSAADSGDSAADSGDSAADSGDSAADSGDSGDSGADSGDSGPRDERLQAALDALRADRATALLDVSRDTGWPAPVDGGWLFVTTDTRTPNLAGDHSGWSPEAMTCETGFCWLVREADAGGGYKFTDGASRWDADPWSRAYAYDEFGEMSRVLPEGEAHLERQFAVEGEGLAPRDLHLYVPAGAIDHVLYAEDGQNLFDPEAFWGGWRLDESVPDGMLVVGIDNTADRMDEYTHVPDYLHGAWYGGEGDTYARYLQDTVRPLIRDVYGESGPVGLLGSSLGGLISFHIADRYPGQFRFAASMSGTMGWGSIGTDGETMLDRYDAAGHRDTALYLDSGGNGTCYDSDGDGLEDDDPSASDNYCENVQLRDLLYGMGYEFEVDLWHWWEPGAEHNEEAWAERVWIPLEIFAAL